MGKWDGHDEQTIARAATGQIATVAFLGSDPDRFQVCRRHRTEKVKANRAFVVFSVAGLDVDVEEARYELDRGRTRLGTMRLLCLRWEW
ncbi:Uu.00g111170.m01.CDS01 [Anthostomella pinea]|uniref:Uu.00g111170.m01.CDS01 n=1 Tax=Anthostomella pinea TaxID=933095 RepID=A0AAI8VF03_9PEZI|nr:Uu.00g111170.m01.CDS01 [Anthostomella pinea]